MIDLETRLAQARNSINVSAYGPWMQNGFDVAANIAREVDAEKDAEIARLKQMLEIERAASSRRTHRGCFG